MPFSSQTLASSEELSNVATETVNLLDRDGRFLIMSLSAPPMGAKLPFATSNLLRGAPVPLPLRAMSSHHPSSFKSNTPW